tara:strand:- start:1964 stop:2260 length:297 start_codon:yes stop_codon:yes gene_type:complete
MRKLLLLLALLLMLPASAQALSKSQATAVSGQIYLLYRNVKAAIKASDFDRACGALQKQNALLTIHMTELQKHFPDPGGDWMRIKGGATKLIRKFCYR